MVNTYQTIVVCDVSSLKLVRTRMAAYSADDERRRRRIVNGAAAVDAGV
jgi:hypothetical protein